MVSAHRCEHEHDEHDGDGAGPEQTFSSQSLYAHIFRERIRTMNAVQDDMGAAIVKAWDARYSTEQVLSGEERRC